MFEFFENQFKNAAGFFIDSQHAITKRLGVALIILGVAFVIDDQVGVTFFFATKQKIELAKEITAIIANDSTDAEASREFRALRLQVLRRKGTVSHLWDLTKSAVNSRTAQTANANPNKIIAPKSNIFLHVISSSWMLLVLSAVGLMGLLLQKKIGGYEVAGIVLLVIFIGVLALAFSFVFSYIPLLGGNPAYNYLLNAILHLLIMILVIRLIANRT